MKIIVVLSNANVGFFRHFDRVVRHLDATGNTLEIVVQRTKGDMIHSPFGAWLAESGARFERAIQPKDSGWQRLLWQVRDTLNYGVYFHPNHPSPRRSEQWRLQLPRSARWVARNGVTRKLLVSGVSQKILRRIEALIPVDSAITRWLAERQPDVVFASPCLLRFGVEMEYIRAAGTLKIPTVVAVPSWDNLTTKGVFHVAPDVTLLWNEVLREEAMTLHRTRGDSILTTGAPGFDYWFDREPVTDRDSFCRQVGLDPGKPFIVYACSSGSITNDEVPFVRSLVSTLRSHHGLENIQIVVRPHVASPSVWTGFAADGVRLWPARGAVPATPETQLAYRNTLHHAHAVLGINTSAFLDAACMDKPCVTVLTERYSDTQIGLGHFRHLLNAGFLETARNAAEAGAIIVKILHGRDDKAKQRREFVRTFIRSPYEPHLSASETMALAIEHVALGRSGQQIGAALAALAKDRGAATPGTDIPDREPMPTPVLALDLSSLGDHPTSAAPRRPGSLQ